MNSQEQFLSGQPFRGTGFILTQFRYCKEASCIEMQVFGPVADLWMYYGLVGSLSDSGFTLSVLLLGQVLTEQEFSFDDLKFLSEVSKEGGEHVGI